MTTWLRNKQQAERYNCTVRSLERAREDGRLPPAKFPFGNKFPANTEAELDEWDRAMVMAARPKNNAVKKPATSGQELNPE